MVEAYENELIDAFFNNIRLISSHNINEFIDSIFKYVRYCRGYSNIKIDDLYDYTKYWVHNFIATRA